MFEDRGLIDDLAAPHRAIPAFKRLMARGQAALPAVLGGLAHASAEARYRCCRLLDHLLTPDALGPLIAMLDDPDERVRCSALHSLSCDRCKEGVCLPTDGPLLAKAMRLLASDPSAHVRAFAIEAVGRSLHADPAARSTAARPAAPRWRARQAP